MQYPKSLSSQGTIGFVAPSFGCGTASIYGPLVVDYCPDAAIEPAVYA